MELDVKNNRLTNLPCEWQINSVYIYLLYVYTFAGDFGSMTSLIILSLTNNHITSLPQSVGKLCNLQELSLQCVNAHSLPTACLRVVSISSNHLTELPDELCDLVNLKVCAENCTTVYRCNVQFADHICWGEQT